MIYFPNKTVTVLEYGESEQSVNIYGEPDPVYSTVGDYQGDFQPNGSSESVEIEGTIYTDTYKLYLPLNTPITSTCEVMIDGEYYEIIGSPSIYEHTSMSHIKAILQKKRQ